MRTRVRLPPGPPPGEDMFKCISRFLQNSKLKKLQKRIERKYIEAVEHQRNGNLREYAQTINDVQAIENEYESLQRNFKP